MEMKKPLVVVLSRVYSTGLSVIRSLGAAGYTVDLVASAHKEGKSAIAACSKYVQNSVEVVSKKVKDGDDTELLNELLKYAGQNEQKPVLFPTDDYTTSIMDMNREVLEEHFIMPHIVNGGTGSITARMDKTVQGEMAKKAGLLTPLEWIFNLEEEIVIPEDMVYPCFCKPIESVTGYKKEMAMCEDENKLRKHLRKLQRKFPNRSILVQEFLNIDNEIDLSGVCLDQEIIIPAIIKNPYYKDPADESDDNPAEQLPVNAEATKPGSATGTVTEHTKTDSNGNTTSQTNPAEQKKQAMAEADASEKAENEDKESKQSEQGCNPKGVHSGGVSRNLCVF